MVALGHYGGESRNLEKENWWVHRPTNQPTHQQGEYSAICLFEGWKIEGTDLNFVIV